MDSLGLQLKTIESQAQDDEEKVVVETETEADAFDIISELPLTKYMKIDIHPLMFHDSADFVFTFSAN